MKKIAIFLFAGLLSLSLNTAIANCGAGCKCKDKCDGKKACTSCKKEETKQPGRIQCKTKETTSSVRKCCSSRRVHKFLESDLATSVSSSTSPPYLRFQWALLTRILKIPMKNQLVEIYL